jgi:hypothetical protein
LLPFGKKPQLTLNLGLRSKPKAFAWIWGYSGGTQRDTEKPIGGPTGMDKCHGSA